MSKRAAIALGLAVSACAEPTPDPVTVTCGAGAMLVDNECVAEPVTCGAGTHEDGGECVGDVVPYQLRVASPLIADGTTSFEVRVFGPQPGVQVVLSTDRPGAGTFQPATLTLDEIGGTAQYVPCASTTPGCTGPIELRVALAAAPATPVARTATTLVAPPGIGSLGHCPPGTNTFYLDGTGYLYDGELSITDGAVTITGGDRRPVIDVLANQANQGSRWTVDMSTVQLGMPLTPGVYLMTYGPFATVPGRAGFQVLGQVPQPNCAPVSDVQVHEAVFAGNRWERLTMSFRQFCQNGTPPVTGCVRYERQP